MTKEARMARMAEARAYIASCWGEEETAEWLACNEGDEEWAIACQISDWARMADEDEEPVPEELVAWANEVGC